MKPSRIELYRRKLQQTLEAVEDGSSEYIRGVRAVVRALKIDFDILFPPGIHQADSKGLLLLIEEYCYQEINACPICGSKTLKKAGPQGYFLGCSSYPLCKGSRNIQGRPTQNEALFDYLADKVYQKKIEEQKKQQDRFANLDL